MRFFFKKFSFATAFLSLLVISSVFEIFFITLPLKPSPFLNHFEASLNVYQSALFFLSIAAYCLALLGFLSQRKILLLISLFYILTVSFSIPMAVGLLQIEDLIRILSSEAPGHHLVKSNPALQIYFGFSSLLLLIMSIAGLVRGDTGHEALSLANRRKAVYFIVAQFLLVGILLPIYIFWNAQLAISSISRGYLELRLGRLDSVEKVYEKNGISVSLVPMVHIGKKGFYEQVMNHHNKRTTAMLREGITDEKKLMREKLSHKELSETLGVSVQEEDFLAEKKDYLFTEIHADIDVALFSKETIDYLNKETAKMNQLTAEKDQSAMKIFAKLIELESNDGPSSKEIKTFFEDIVVLRNQAAFDTLQAAIEENNDEQLNFNHFVIPWGALHMPGIENSILGAGFKLKNEIPRRVF